MQNLPIVNSGAAHETMEALTEQDTASPMLLSAEAVLELDELRAGLRSDVPSLGKLLHALRTPSPSPTFEGHGSVSMLADVRSYSVLRDALGAGRTRTVHNTPELQQVVDLFLKQLESGVAEKNPERLEEAKAFCKALGNQLSSRQMRETYQRREKSDSRYTSHDALF